MISMRKVQLEKVQFGPKSIGGGRYSTNCFEQLSSMTTKATCSRASDQSNQIGRFLKVLGNKFVFKSIPNI